MVMQVVRPEMKKMTDIAAILKTAIQRFLATDGDLIRRHAHEQAISARLAVQLEMLLPDWHVNCEYNRQGGGIDPKEDSTGAHRRPDIIVHERGHDHNNLLVVEVKPEWAAPKSIEEDRQKLRHMLPSPRQYQFAYLVLYGEVPEPRMTFERIE
jgi:hypothetical protein